MFCKIVFNGFFSFWSLSVLYKMVSLIIEALCDPVNTVIFLFPCYRKSDPSHSPLERSKSITDGFFCFFFTDTDHGSSGRASILSLLHNTQNALYPFDKARLQTTSAILLRLKLPMPADQHPRYSIEILKESRIQNC